MSSTLSNGARSQEGTCLDSVRPSMAKAVTPSHTPLRRVIDQVIRQTGNVKAQAGDMQIDRAQLYRQLENGNLTIGRLEALGAAFCAALGRELVEQFGPLTTPAARAKQKVREMRAALEEIDQALELI